VGFLISFGAHPDSLALFSAQKSQSARRCPNVESPIISVSQFPDWQETVETELSAPEPFELGFRGPEDSGYHIIIPTIPEFQGFLGRLAVLLLI
jgi:hypothetical protein